MKGREREHGRERGRGTNDNVWIEVLNASEKVSQKSSLPSFGDERKKVERERKRERRNCERDGYNV